MDSNFEIASSAGNDWLGINSSIHQQAMTNKAFTGPSCIYDLTFHAVGEQNGSAVFTVIIDGHFLGSYEGAPKQMKRGLSEHPLITLLQMFL